MDNKIMRYEEFIDAFKAMIIEKCKEQNNNIEIEFNTIQKVNGLKDCFMASTKARDVKLTLYFEELYKDYSKSGNMEDVCNSVIETIKNDSADIDTSELISIISDIEVIRSRISLFVINAEYNFDFLNLLPHRHFLDLAIVYKFSLFRQGDVVGKVMLTNDMMQKWGVTEEELYEISMSNTEKLFPTIVQNISPGFSIVSNSNNVNGASAIINKEMFREIANKREDNLYIVPSSIHELIILNCSNHNSEDVKSVIEHVNNDVLNREDILSYNLYTYERETDSISIVLDKKIFYS